MLRYWKRITRSARGELFNPLLWPFLLTTLAYGLGFTLFTGTNAVMSSSLLSAMVVLHSVLPVIWGVVAIVTILGGLTFLLFNIPPYGRISGILGFMLWLFAAFCWGFDGNWLLVAAVAVPNMWFWIWQFFSLSIFSREDAVDKQTLKDSNYDSVKQEMGGDDNTHRNHHYEG